MKGAKAQFVDLLSMSLDGLATLSIWTAVARRLWKKCHIADM